MKRFGAIETCNAALTAAFLVSSGASAVLFASPWKQVAVGVCLAAFTVGVVAFLWGYWTAVQRSRHDEISVGALYFLSGGVAPRSVSATMNILLAVQVVAGISFAIARSSTNGKPGSTLAFGILVPMLGLGLNGLWGSRHGVFAQRRHETSAPPDDDGRRVATDEPPNGQDGVHD